MSFCEWLRYIEHTTMCRTIIEASNCVYEINAAAKSILKK